MFQLTKAMRRWLPIAGILVLAACSGNNPNAGNSASNTEAAGGANTANTEFAAAKGCKNVGVLLPESDSSARYEAYDRPLLEREIKAAIPDVTIQYANANNNATTQQNQAEAALTKGACILVVDPNDSDQASVIVQQAKASGVPVIAYDRLIQDPDTAFYVSFDNERVGELQGQYIVDQYKAGNLNLQKGATLVMINGSQTDNNALLFRKGALKALQPLIDSGDLNLVFDQYTPNWDNARAQSLMEGVLTKEGNDVDIAYVANDGMANTVIAALRTQKLNGKVLVTGQDATATGIQNILTGDQTMTIYKPIAQEAKATARLVAALSNGEDVSSQVNGQTEIKGGGQIPSVLETPIAVDKNNVESTVVKDGYLTKEQICSGLSEDNTGFCN
ncbi:sugar ABC transporter substrate-binding protein [Leptolyngbya sp. FACHB-711]|uniref:sugar ABC transporter substrate-binding protein n=1 Tax=unclassified Leptolyngbya TaxID=2650499 RepID=UPI0016886C31|nr:sugar ABC transporter substrate-binding protein [Leptolyngbya sp. FACHB-711]MBD1849995.1 sugar ABC transporter substrate-binding protein [Cyanobacteria bacterium FACHB-502]MBD2027490.1 sugar ABC transporter substrate-binding protein [Leptolyngbya sp. FACHB-711]